VTVVVTGPTGWLTYKRRTSMLGSFLEIYKFTDKTSFD